MKYYQRLLCVLLCCVLLFPVSSLSASAANEKDYKIKITTKLTNDLGTYSKDSIIVYPNNDTLEQLRHTFDNGIPKNTTKATILNGYIIEYTDGTVMIEKGRKTTFSLNNVYQGACLYNTKVSVFPAYDRGINSIRALAYYKDGTFKYYDDVTIEEPSTNTVNFTLEFTPEKDIYKIEFIVYNEIGMPNLTPVSTDTLVDVYTGEFIETKWDLQVNQQSEEAGLLSGMIEWLKSIKECITDLFSNVKEGFQNMLSKLQETLDNIKQIPNKIWSLIENGLKKLFIPSDTYIVQFKNDIETLLEDRLGAVYQSIQVILDTWDKVKDYDSRDTIEVPTVSIHLPGGNIWTYGGWSVKIVPDGFIGIASSVKLLTTIGLILAFINGLRKRYDEVMGVES